MPGLYGCEMPATWPMGKDDIGLDEIKEPIPLSRDRAAVHRTAAFSWVRVLHRRTIKKNSIQKDGVLFWWTI